jgi:hypothetical protein
LSALGMHWRRINTCSAGGSGPGVGIRQASGNTRAGRGTGGEVPTRVEQWRSACEPTLLRWRVVTCKLQSGVGEWSPAASYKCYTVQHSHSQDLDAESCLEARIHVCRCHPEPAVHPCPAPARHMSTALGQTIVAQARDELRCPSSVSARARICSTARLPVWT